MRFRDSFIAYVLVTLTALAASAQDKPATKPVNAGKAERIASLEKQYADLYARPLQEKNRLSQLIAVISLSRVSGEPTTKKLVAAFAELDPLVGQLAWEAVHARQATLPPKDRDKWLAGGADIARQGGFPGATIAPLLAALSEKPASTFKALPEIMIRVASENDPQSADGKPALEAAGKAIATWRDPKLVQVLLARLQAQPALAPRIAVMLAALPDQPEADVSDPVKFRNVWSRYVRVNKLTPEKTLPKYEGVSKMFPAPEAIVDPDDKKWRKDLELPRLQIDSVEIALCIDATGSLETYNAFIAAYVDTVMRMMRLMSDQVRGGVVYYQHEVDAALMLPCCKEAPKQKEGFRTRVIEFSADPKSIVKQMLALKLVGKTGHRKDNSSAGAYAGGIETAMKLRWTPKGKHIIVCTGDDKATPGSEKKLLELAEKTKDDGTLLLFVVRDDKAGKSIAPVAKAATGIEPIQYKPDIEKLKAAEAEDEKDKKDTSTSAIEQFKGTAFEKMTTNVIALSLPEGFRDRVPPLIAAVLPILQAQDAVAKASVGMAVEKK